MKYNIDYVTYCEYCEHYLIPSKEDGTLPKPCQKCLRNNESNKTNVPTQFILNKEFTCPNPKGEEGICYAFDRHGDRAGCLRCPSYTQKMFKEKDPLPGLTAYAERIKKELEEE